jgi:hypothetical protein
MTKQQQAFLFNLAVTGVRQMSLEQASQMLQELAPIKAEIDAPEVQPEAEIDAPEA